MTKLILTSAFSHGAYIGMLGGDTVTLMVPSRYRPYEACGMSKEMFSQFYPYWSLLEDAASRGDVKYLELLAPRSDYQQGLRALQAKLANVSQITILGGKTFDGTQVPEVELNRSIESEVRRTWTLTVLGKDKDGHEVVGQLIALGGGGFHFSLPRTSGQ
jgi:hypothetical protein